MSAADELESGFYELGQAVQDTLVAFYSENMASAHEYVMTLDGILDHFAELAYHIHVIQQIVHPERDGHKGWILERDLCFLNADGDCSEVGHADIIVGLIANQEGSVVARGEITIQHKPIPYAAADDPFSATSYFDEMLHMIQRGKDKKGH